MDELRRETELQRGDLMALENARLDQLFSKALSLYGKGSVGQGPPRRSVGPSPLGSGLEAQPQAVEFHLCIPGEQVAVAGGGHGEPSPACWAAGLGDRLIEVDAVAGRPS